MSDAVGGFRKVLEKIQPRKAVILGSGLGVLPRSFESHGSFAQSDVSELPRGTVVGHSGALDVGFWAGHPVLVCQGRVHFYEGHPLEKVVTLVRSLPAWGIRDLLLFNATGGIDPTFVPGSAVLIDSYWNATGPLWNLKNGQPVWHRPTGRLSPGGRDALGLPLGRYVMVSGPSYETRAEVRALRTLGAQVVGMSSALELEASHQIGLNAHLVSVIANHACGMTDSPLSHAEVCEVMAQSVELMQGIVSRWVA